MFLEHPGKDLTVLEVNALTSPKVEYLGAFTVWPRDYPNNRLSVGPMFPPPELKIRHPLGELVLLSDVRPDHGVGVRRHRG